MRRILLILTAIFTLSCSMLAAPLGLATPTPAAQRPRGQDVPGGAGSDDRLCVGTFGYGAACLDSIGWQIYSDEGGQLGTNQISAVAACPDGRLLLLHTMGISILTAPGGTWLEMNLSNDYHLDHLLCTADNEVWGYDYDTVQRLHEGFWYQTALDALVVNPDMTNMLRDLEPSPEGELWALTWHNLARSQAAEWDVYGEGEDWEDRANLEQIAFDSRGRTWLATMEGIYRYENETIRLAAKHNLFSPEEMRIASDGALWIATNQGIEVYHSGAWQNYTFSDQGLASDTIRDLEIDQRGRVWAATDWGLLVYEGGQWRALHMHDSALPGNFIMGLVVYGRGPDLPEPVETRPGGLRGTLLAGGKPLGGADLEVCVEYMSWIFETPCSGQPLVARGTTRSDGSFMFRDLPVGYYYLAARAEGGKWQNITGPGPAPRPVPVKEGSLTELGEIELAE